MMIYAIDFDGTLCENMFPKIGLPRSDLVEFCKARKDAGDRLILWTCRKDEQLDEAVAWCAALGLVFDAVNANLLDITARYGGDTRKVHADFYVDDKNLDMKDLDGKGVMKLKCEIRADGLHVFGYVNVTGKMSKPVITRNGQKVIEVIEERAFHNSLQSGENVTMTLDHREERVLAQTKDKSIELREDAIGLHADTIITDPEVIGYAKAGKIRGWSFGMKNVVDTIEERGTNLPLRHVKGFILDHVTLVVNKSPLYSATSVEYRAEDAEPTEMEFRGSDSEVEITQLVETPKEKIDYSQYEARINKFK